VSSTSVETWARLTGVGDGADVLDVSLQTTADDTEGTAKAPTSNPAAVGMTVDGSVIVPAPTMANSRNVDVVSWP
jgi:hypothetical protein